MKVRPLVALGLLLVGTAALAAGPVPQPWQPPKSAPARTKGIPKPIVYDRNGKPVSYVDGVPDTGQFLADTDILGRVDDREFSVREFREYWFASYGEYRPRPDSAGRHEFLQSMVNKEILAQLAKQVNKPFDFEDRAQMRETNERVLSNITFSRLVADSARPSQDELRHAYAQGLFLLHLQHIVAADRATAEKARADVLSRKLTWAAAVHAYSTRLGDKGADGDLGFVARGAFDPTVALAVFDLKDGQLSDVFQDADGWQVVRVVARRPNPQPPFENISGVIEHDLEPMKIAQRVEQVRAQIRNRIGMVYDSTNIGYAASLFGSSQASHVDASGTPVLDLTGAVPDFSPADTARVLARWKDGRFTLGQFLEDFRALNVLQRPTVNSFDLFRSSLDSFVLEPYMADLARERGYDRDPQVQMQLDKRREQIMVEHLFADSVQSKVWITPEERQAYYQERKQEFFSYQNVTFAALVRPTKAGADSLVARLRAGEKPQDILHADSLRGLDSGSIKSMREDEHGPYEKLLFEEMREGQVEEVGPDRQGDFLVMQKLAHDHGRLLPYAEVSSIVDESLQNIKGEKLLKELIARHTAGHRIEIHPELLMRIRLVDPSLD